MESINELPTGFLLQAAHWVSRLLADTPSTQLDLSNAYLTVPTGGIFGVDDLRRGQQLLIESGLVEQHRELLAPTEGLSGLAALNQEEANVALLLRILERRRPTWLFTCLRPDGVAVDLLPENVVRTFHQLRLDPDQREALLLAAGRRVDPNENTRLGAAGEEHVASLARRELIDRGRSDLAHRVQRVSLISDQLGYDISAPGPDGRSRHWEVKTTRARFRCHVVLSRNEADTGARDRAWALVVCREVESRTTLLGWCRMGTLEQYLPADPRPEARWLSVEFTMADQELAEGLPP
jgi:hypothetical protein